jgi:hypothetical protein
MPDGTGSAPKKETVYGGTTPPALDNKAFANPSSGTVYSGPAPAAGGTVFDENKFVPKKIDSSVAREATKKKVRRQTWRFFIVASLSFIEVLLYWSSDPSFAVSSAIVCGVFLSIGIYAYRLSRTAFYIGTAIYGAQTLFLLYLVFFTDAGFLFWAEPLIIHALIVYRLWVAIGHLEELLQAE